MSKIDEINNAVAESGKRTKAAASASGVSIAQSTFPVYGADVVKFNKSSIVPKSGSDFLLCADNGIEDKTNYGFILSDVTHGSFKFDFELLSETFSKEFPIIKEIKKVDHNIIAILDKSQILIGSKVSSLLDSCRNGIHNHINYEAIPKILFSLASNKNIFAYENNFILILNPQILAVNFLIKNMIKTNDVTVSPKTLAVVREQVLKTMKINTAIQKKHLGVAVEFNNLDYLSNNIVLDIPHDVLVAVNVQLTTDAFSFKAQQLLKNMDQSAVCLFTSANNLLKDATKGDAISKCIVKPKAMFSDIPVIKLSNDYLHTNLKGSAFDHLNTEKVCDEYIISQVFNKLINDKPVTIKSLETGSLYLVPDVFKMLQYTILKTTNKIEINDNDCYINVTPIVTPSIRVNMNINKTNITAMFTI